MTTLLVMTDGRKDCLTRTINSIERNLKGRIDSWVIHSDCKDERFNAWLIESFGAVVIVNEGDHGYSKAIRNAWSHIKDDYVIHWEDDFVLKRPVNVDVMKSILDDNPDLIQVALLRQPWNLTEIQAGGIVECDPEAYEQMDGFYRHRKFFTTNPCVYRGSLVQESEWPDAEFSEGLFGLEMWEQGYYSSYLGEKFESPTVEHIGYERTGDGY